MPVDEERQADRLERQILAREQRLDRIDDNDDDGTDETVDAGDGTEIDAGDGVDPRSIPPGERLVTQREFARVLRLINENTRKDNQFRSQVKRAVQQNARRGRTTRRMARSTGRNFASTHHQLTGYRSGFVMVGGMLLRVGQKWIEGVNINEQSTNPMYLAISKVLGEGGIETGDPLGDMLLQGAAFFLAWSSYNNPLTADGTGGGGSGNNVRPPGVA